MRKQTWFVLLLSLIMVTVLVSALCVTTATAQPLMMGDIDQSGKVDSGDMRLVLRHIIGVQPLEVSAMKQADCNGDGKINTIDVHMMMEWSSSGETVPTLPTTPTTAPTTSNPSWDDDGYYDEIVKP